MPMDFMRNPVFFPGGTPPTGFNGELFVNGNLKVTLKGSVIEGDAQDVFFALADRARKEDFKSSHVSFTVNDLLKQLNLGRHGRNYSRIHKAVYALLGALIEIKGLTCNGKIMGFFHILNSAYFYQSHTEKKTTGNESLVKFSEEILELFRIGNFKLVHPVYFQLPGPLDKKLFVLISVRASDLSIWEIKSSTLRDLMPLLGKKYETSSGVLQQLSRNLKNLEKMGVIHGFEFLKEGNRKDPVVAIRPNHEYFCSQGRPAKHFLEKKEIAAIKEKPVPSSENTIVSMLIAQKVSKKVAMDLSLKYTEEEIKEKIQFVKELIMGNKNIKSPPAFLVDAIRNGYEHIVDPELALRKEKDERKKKNELQLGELKTLMSDQKFEKALELGNAILGKQRSVSPFSSRIEELVAKAKQHLNQDHISKDELAEMVDEFLTSSPP